MKPTTLLRPLLAASITLAAAGAAQGQAFDAVRLYGDPSGDGAGTAGVAAVAQRRGEFAGLRVATPICGGNLTEEQIRRWLL